MEGMVLSTNVSHYEYCVMNPTDDGKMETVPFKTDSDLQKNIQTSGAKCLREFLDKGGNFQHFSADAIYSGQSIKIAPGDTVYPICSGGFCRSQVLWALLLPFSDQIELFPPHAARHGWDPYNGQINRYRNASQENIPDDFDVYFKHEKAERFGFSQVAEWEKLTLNEQIPVISQYYGDHYFGPKKKEDQKRVFIAFSNNVHILLYRLAQVNDSLEHVHVVSVDLEDLVTFPPEEWSVKPRSSESYERFKDLLSSLVDTRALENQ